MGCYSEPPPPPDLIDGEEHCKLEAALDSRLQRNFLKYLVKWKGYGYEHNSWVPEHVMVAKDLVQKFHQDHPNASQGILHMAFQSLAFLQLQRIHGAPGMMHLKGG